MRSWKSDDPMASPSLFPSTPSTATLALAALLALAFAPALPAQEIRLRAPEFFAAELEPSCFGAADLDGNGALDFALANARTADVTILLGDGKGAFTTSQTLPVDPGPANVATGDFDGDGIPDLVVVSGASSGVTVHPGDGEGRFGPGFRADTGISPFGVVVADFDEDGRLDVATANRGSDDVSVLLGRGDGTLAPATSFAAEGFPLRMVSGDFDEDGHLDLVVGARLGGRLLLFHGDGAGGFAPGAVLVPSDGPVETRAGDFDGDGHLDLAAALDDGLIAVYLGDGLGGFGPPAEVEAAPFLNSCDTGDVNRDGVADLIVASNNLLVVVVLLGDGAGGFAPAGEFPIGFSSPRCTIVADFNGDCADDVATLNFGIDRGVVAVLFNQTFQPHEVSLCTQGSVNDGAGATADVLFVNGGGGRCDRTVEVEEGGQLFGVMLPPPARGSGRYVVHADLGPPDRSRVSALPAGIGTTCFPFLLPRGAMPIAVWNNAGRERRVGASRGFGGEPLPPPDPAPAVFFHLPAGDPDNLPAGTEVTFQAIVLDPASAGAVEASASNAVVLRIL